MPQPIRLRTLFAGLALALTAAAPVGAQSTPGLELEVFDNVPAARELLRRGSVPAPPTGVAPDDAPDAPALVPGGAVESAAPDPFGANLFRGGFTSDREDGLNPNYVIQPGDRVTVRVWGAIEFGETLAVDARGNIFVPRVGPVTVGGTRNADLNARVTGAVRSVFTDNVRVYTHLDGTQPVAVFVTGNVPRPGRFSGIPSNSALHFIDRAGGIDPVRGSYRDVRVVRDGRTLASIDLYDFLLDGTLPQVQFRDGDTVVIGERGATVEVSGGGGPAASFELVGDTIAGQELARRAQTGPEVSHAGVSGIRAGVPFALYLTLAEFADFTLADGDVVSFASDVHEREIVVEVEGAHVGPSRFAVPVDTRLQEILDYIVIDPALADVDALSLRRESIAERQRSSLEESLQRLESRYLTASSATDAESRIRAQEAKLISDFVARARTVEPNGRLVVASGGEVADVLLQNGDVITIPRKSDTVLLSGEVLVSQAMLHDEDRRARDYIDRAGGFTDQAERDRIVVVHANGEVATDSNPRVRPGDEIIVLPEAPVKNLQLAATLADILYKVAVAAAVVIQL